MDANLESLRGLEQNLTELGYDTSSIPIVMQWNKRDLPNVVPEQDLERRINPEGFPAFGASAVSGEGVFDTLKAITKLVLMNLRSNVIQPKVDEIHHSKSL